MNHDKFYDSLSSLLERGRINHVIEVLRNKCYRAMESHPDLCKVAADLERIDETYGHLRRFLLDGGPDPERGKIYSDIKLRLKDLARRYLFIVNEDRLDSFFAEYRLQKVRNRPVAEISEELKKNAFRIEMATETEADTLPFRLRHQEIMDSLFRKVWSLPPSASEDHKAIKVLLEEKVYSSASAEEEFEIKSQLISALLLGSLKFNDPDKFQLLINAYEAAPDDRLAARALMAIVLVLGRWGASAVSTPELSGAIQSLEDSILTYSRIRDVVMTLIRTRDTDRVSREVTDAFNSTMKEITPEMLEKLQKEGLTADSSETGLNPEWEKLLQNKEIEDKMKSINDMQLEGMDVMMQTFSRLKTFSFFRSLSNWFIPFSSCNPAVSPLFNTFNGEGFNLMAEVTDMCASDRYSFALGIMQMPEERRNMLAMHFGSQLEAIRDLLKDRENVRRKPEFASEALVYARDLYRFAKLFPKKKDFHDPFEEPIDFLSLPLLGSLLEGDEIILTSADFYFRHGYFAQALALYEKIASSADADRELFEKMGYCRQMAGDYAGALADYEKADLFSTDVDRSSTWLLKKLAFCNKALGRYDAAADYYSRLLELHPDDLKLEFHLGSVLLRGGDIRRGKELISKVHYMDPDHKMASRIYTRLKGHEAFLDNRFREALALYEEARGNQDSTEYRTDLVDELKSIDPNADTVNLQILLDSGD